MLPEDVIRYIYTFCDIDTRLRMRIPPSKISALDAVFKNLPTPNTINSYHDEEEWWVTRWDLGGLYTVIMIQTDSYFGSTLVHT